MLKKNFNNQSIVQICVKNVKPILETRKIRKFRSTYKVPLVVGLTRQEGKAILVITQSFSERSGDENFNISQIPCFVSKTKNALKNKKFNNNLNIDDIFTYTLGHRFYKKKDKKNKNLIASLDTFLRNNYKIYNKNQDKSLLYLSDRFFSAFYKKVEILDNRKVKTQDALKNRAYLNYRWW